MTEKNVLKKSVIAIAVTGMFVTTSLHGDDCIECNISDMYMGDVYQNDSSGSTNENHQMIDRSPTVNTGGNDVSSSVDGRLQQSNNLVDQSGSRQTSTATGGSAFGNTNDQSNFGNSTSNSTSNSGGNILGNDATNNNTFNPTMNDIGGRGGNGGNGFGGEGGLGVGIGSGGEANVSDTGNIGEISNHAAGGEAKQGQIGINAQTQGIDRSGNSSIDRSGNSANANKNAQGQDQNQTSKSNANARQGQGQSSANKNVSGAKQGQSSRNQNDSKASGNKTSFTDKSSTSTSYKNFTIIPAPLPGVPPSVVANGQIVHSVGACGVLQAVVSRNVTGKYFGIVSDSDINLGETDRLVPVTYNGKRVAYWQKVMPNGDIYLLGSQVSTWAVPANISGSRQLGLGGGNYGAQGQATLGSSAAMNQLVVHHEVTTCNAGIIKFQPVEAVTNISE